MTKEQTQLVDFITQDGSTYKTQLTPKLERCKKYKRTNPLLIESFLPGCVTKIFVTKGDSVTKGSPLIAIESMKMENIIKSATNGTIKNIFVEEGNHIPKGTVMIELG